MGWEIPLFPLITQPVSIVVAIPNNLSAIIISLMTLNVQCDNVIIHISQTCDLNTALLERTLHVH